MKKILRAPGEGFLLRAIQLSGFTALGYEMLWVRRFSHFFGSTAQIFSMILVAVLSGIALGAFAFARLSRRVDLGLRRYGYLEAGIAISSTGAYLASGWLPQWIEKMVPTEQGWVTSLLAFVVTFLLTGLTCSLIGGSLPWLTQVVARRHGDRSTARAYAFYNLGSALATVVVGSLLFLIIGYARCCVLLAALNAALGVYFFSVGDTAARSKEIIEAQYPRPGVRVGGVVLLIGFVTLFVETLHGQLLDYLLGGTRLGISATLGTYFVAVSLGAARARTGGRRSKASGFASAGQAALRESLWIQLLSLITLAGLVFLPNPFATFVDGKWLAGIILLVYAVYSFAGGRQFPALVRWLTEATGARESTSFVYAFYVETLAGIAGTLVFSFVCLPRLGTETSTLVAIGLTALAAALVAGHWRAIALVPATASFALLLIGPRPAGLSLVRSAIASLNRGDQVRYAREDSSGLLMVVQKREGELEIRNAYDVSGSTDVERRNTQLTQGWLAASLLPENARVLQIGYGNGQITRALLAARPQAIDLVEIHPQMMAVADRFFGGVVPGSTVIQPLIQDGVAYARGCRRQYDLAISDGFVISSEMSVRLYTRDHFLNLKRILDGRGILLTWIPTYVGTASSLSILKTLTETFRHVQLFYPTFGLGHEIYAISYDDSRDLLETQRQGLERIADAMTESTDLPIDPGFFWTRWLAGDAAVRTMVARHPEVMVNEEDRPVLEYYASVKRRHERGPTLLEELVAARQPEAIAGELSQSPELLADWRKTYHRFRALEAATLAYLSAPSAEKAAALRRGFPRTNLAALAEAVEQLRQSREPASK